jgi:membrane protease YdiL (CAAX protease family)
MVDTLHRIEDLPDTDSRPSRLSPLVAVLAALWMVLGFLFVQLAALALVGPIRIEGQIGAPQAWQLALVQSIGIAVVVLVVALGVTSWRRLGVVGSPAGAFDAGWRLLMPVGLLVIGPTVGYALFSDRDVIHADIDLVRTLAFVVLAGAIALNEELWFRGLVVDQLERAGRPWLVVGAGAVLFGAPHVAASPASWLNAAAVTLAVAVPFTIARLHVRSIWPLVLWHALIDIWAFLHTASVVPQGSPSLVDALATLVLPALIAAGYVVWWRRRGTAQLTP